MVTRRSQSLSLVCPVYNNESSLRPLYSRSAETISNLGLKLELVFIDDGSTDDSWKIIQELCKTDNRVRGYRFARNFGQQTAIRAGLERTTGDFVVVMDADLQDRPEHIELLFSEILASECIVVAKSIPKKHRSIRRLASKVFYRLFSSLSGLQLDQGLRNFRIFNREVKDLLLSFEERGWNLVLLSVWTGKRTKFVDVETDTRVHGKSSYDITKLFMLGLGSISSFTVKPLRASILFGFSVALASILAAISLAILAISGLFSVQGWASLIVAISFLSGLLMAQIGVVGLYVGSTFSELQKRPHYIIQERVEHSSMS